MKGHASLIAFRGKYIEIAERRINTHEQDTIAISMHLYPANRCSLQLAEGRYGTAKPLNFSDINAHYCFMKFDSG